MPDRARTSPIVGLCLVALILEGYDILMYGSVVPSLQSYKPWGLNAAEIGVLGSLTGFGMLAGALGATAVADRWGRRRTLLTAAIIFSAAMGLCAVAPSPQLFGVGRFVVGLGAGAIMPTAAALLFEFSPTQAHGRSVGLGFVGTAIGGVLAGVLSVWLIPVYGFRSMFVAGLVPGIVLVPALMRFLPESPAYLFSQGRHAESMTIAKRYGLDSPSVLATIETKPGSRVRALFGTGRAMTTVMFWCMALLSLLVLFGVATWLPTVMKSSGYPLGTSLLFLVALMVGAGVGAAGGGALGDRFGLKPITAIFFLLAALSLLLIITRPPVAVIYVLVIVAGVGTIGTQVVLNALIGSHYPAASRETGIGSALAVGRVGAIIGPTYGGFLVGFSVGPTWQLIAFAVPSILGAALTVLLPRTSPVAVTTGTRGALEGWQPNPERLP